MNTILNSNKNNSFIEYVQITLQFFIGLFILTILKLFFNFKIEGSDKVVEKLKECKKEKKGLLFAPNHISEYDVLIMRYALPLISPIMPMYYVSMTKEHYQNDKFGWRKYFYGGYMFKILGAYPAYVGVKDYKISLVNHIKLLENGKTVCIFPEGRLGEETYKPAEAKAGIGFLAEYTKTDIVPVQLKGLSHINWSNVFFKLSRPTIEIKYRDIVSIDNISNQLKNDELYKDDIIRYKKIASLIMDKVWE